MRGSAGRWWKRAAWCGRWVCGPLVIVCVAAWAATLFVWWNTKIGPVGWSLDHGCLSVFINHDWEKPDQLLWLSELPGYELGDRFRFIQIWPSGGHVEIPNGPDLLDFTLPLWIPLLVCGIGAWWGWARVVRRKKGACRECGYSLSGLPEGAACPECGWAGKGRS